MHQKPGQPGRAGARCGEAASVAVSDEATLARHAQTDCGACDLLGQALARENMARAWKRVKANKGSAGVDGRPVQETGEYLKQAWPDIRARLLDGSYRPSAVRRVGIPKPGGGTRELGIPTAVDRLIQQALLQVLQLVGRDQQMWTDALVESSSWLIGASQQRTFQGTGEAQRPIKQLGAQGLVALAHGGRIKDRRQSSTSPGSACATATPQPPRRRVGGLGDRG